MYRYLVHIYTIVKIKLIVIIYLICYKYKFIFKGIQQLHRFKTKHPNIDIEPHISKTTKYFQDYIRHKLSAIEDNLKSCLVEPNGTVVLPLLLNKIKIIVIFFYSLSRE